MAKKIIFIISTIIAITLCLTLIFNTSSEYNIYKREKADNNYAKSQSEYAKIKFDTNDAIKLLLDFENYDVFISKFITYSQPGNISYAPYDYEYDGYVMVSQNYFDYYNIQDINNMEVQIFRNTENGILLVPEHYKSEEEGLLEYYKGLREKALSEDIKNNIETTASPDIDIYYIKDDQAIDTFSSFYSSNNIINVVTTKNIIHSSIDFTQTDIIAYKGDKSIERFKEGFINNTLGKYDLRNSVKDISVAVSINDFNEKHYYRLVILHSIFIIIVLIAILAILYFGKKFFPKNEYILIISLTIIVSFLIAKFIP